MAEQDSLVRTGRAWVFGNDISTDLIMPGAILWGHVKGADARKAAMMPNRPGWAADEVRPGDLIVAGTNFGCGSSRSAPRVLRDELNLSCVVAESFSRLFQRNAVNIGFPVLICPGIAAFASEGDELEVDFDSGLVRNLTQGTELCGEPYPPDSPPGQLLRMGGLRPFLERWLDEHPEVRAPGGR
jgi:3-isopropylmalate/(R)-2-methylmalate dehydratase small subunit